MHLHPTAQNKLVEAFIEIINKEQKQFVISTHSEAFVSAILAKIEQKIIHPDKVSFYLCKKEEGKTKLEKQQINEYGQVEGGLVSFMESQLEDLKAILGVENNEEGNND
jgi:predicted ATPase